MILLFAKRKKYLKIYLTSRNIQSKIWHISTNASDEKKSKHDETVQRALTLVQEGTDNLAEDGLGADRLNHLCLGRPGVPVIALEYSRIFPRTREAQTERYV